MSTPLRVLMFHDVPGWAWWHRVRNIQAHLRPQVLVDNLHVKADFDHRNYDFILIFEAAFLDRMPGVPREKIVVGCSCPLKLEETLAAVTSGGVAAGMVNNQAMYERVGDSGQFFLCQNGVDAELFHPAASSVSGLVGCWVGNSDSIGRKGLGLIRHACETAGVELLALDQAKNVWRGDVFPHERVRDEVYHRASFYICASQVEGTPNPALEALACGLPVITTPVGNMPEIIRDGVNGCFVSRTVQSLAEAIERLKASDLEIMSANARHSVLDGWTWHQKARNYARMFGQLAKREMSEAVHV